MITVSRGWVAEDLEANGWYDRHTMKIEFAIPVYNAEFGVHTIVFVNFYKSRGGHIFKKVIPRSQHASWHYRWWFIIIDCVWLLCVLYIMFKSITDIILKYLASALRWSFPSFSRTLTDVVHCCAVPNTWGFIRATLSWRRSDTNT